MIKVNGFVIRPTMFPDGTSQIWKLPDNLLQGKNVIIVWQFEAERELIDLFSLRALISTEKIVTLRMPYLPYARQDKDISNNATFNLTVFAKLINSLQFHSIETMDAHNPDAAKSLIKNFINYNVASILTTVTESLAPDCVVFPDEGAYNRYYKYILNPNVIIFEKVREPLTGNIISHNFKLKPKVNFPNRSKFLIVDDICDGGATFISIANLLNTFYGQPKIFLYTTHGIYSKGMKPLHDAGITCYTTNSILKNVEGFNV